MDTATADPYLSMSECIIRNHDPNESNKNHCTVCVINMSEGSVQAHLDSTKHKRKKANRSSVEDRKMHIDTSTSSPSANSPSTHLADPYLRMSDCITFNPDPVSRNANKYRCSICMVSFSEGSVKPHLDSLGHSAKERLALSTQNSHIAPSTTLIEGNASLQGKMYF